METIALNTRVKELKLELIEFKQKKDNIVQMKAAHPLTIFEKEDSPAYKQHVRWCTDILNLEDSIEETREKLRKLE